MEYRHTQIGYVILFALFAAALVCGLVLTQAGLHIPVLVLMVLTILFLASFASLTTTIDKEHLHIRFGWGPFKKSFALKDMVSARAVRNRWYYGWGIRIWFWPYMWIYNVSGFDAVEVTLRDGTIYRFGTDEPERLERAILQSIRG